MIPLIGSLLLAASLAPASHVDPFVGTSGTQIGGPIDTFPGADMPFGMIQWSPDTPSQNAGGGYEYGDSSITGFSLTHLSGPGCSVFGDFGILPVSGPIQGDPSTLREAFSHASERAAPGYYAVTLGTPPMRVQLSVTDRTGLGVFTFSSPEGGLVLDPASNQAGVTQSFARAVGDHEVIAQASSGYFCGMPDRYTVYMEMRFDRPFTAARPLTSHDGHPRLWLRFDTSRNRTVRAQVALSFVDADGAAANLHTEARSWNIVRVRNRALAAWSRILSRIRVSGGTADATRQFYTALYHATLHPNLIDDADGRYRGFDGRVHHVLPGHHEYANYSDWDIYRTQIPLVALIAPRRTSDMMQSLVDAYEQSGWLPRWALVNNPTSVMGGDSVDAVLAGGYAFGARDFDVRTALRGMIKGATNTTDPPGYGWYIERPESADYQRLGYIPNTHTTSVSPVPNGASETLEYALDDASIAAFARAIGDEAAYRRFLPRASNWANLFDVATGWIAPRDEHGAFQQTPIGEAGQSGFQEGNAAQYTWMVPQDLPGLIRGMGGAKAAAAKLDTFFAQLNAGQSEPYAWMGNEPSIGSPWAYLATGEPWREEAVVRMVMQTLYSDRPDGIPGNDDLGTMSAWYVWSSLGLYPQFTAERNLDIGTPAFSHIVIAAPDGPHITIDAPRAGGTNPYVASLRLNGTRWNRSWFALPMRGTVHLAYRVSSKQNDRWAASPDDAMPAFAPFAGAFPASTRATISLASSSIALLPDQRTSVALQVHDGDGALAYTVSRALHATVTNGALHVSAAGPGLYNVTVSAKTPNGALLAPVRLAVRVANLGEVLPLAWIANRFDNTVMPYDPQTNALGPSIAVGQEPRDGALTPDNRRYFVADRSAQAVSVVDTVAQRVIATIHVGNSPNGTAISRDGTTVWVANYDDGTIQAIDTASLRASAPIAVGSGPRYIAIAPDGTRLYVTDQRANSVSVVDTRTHAVVATWKTGATPTGVSLSPDGRTLYVANNGTQNVTVINTTDGRTLATIPAGVEAQMVAVSPDGTKAFVPNFSSDTLTPIDLHTLKAGADIVVGGEPFDVQWLPDGSAAIVILRRDNALVRVSRDGTVGPPLFLGSGGAYTISIAH